MAQAYVYEDDATGWRLMATSDLPNSGVTATTYGDATHVGQFAVNAQGVITSASNVAISAGSGITDLTSTGGTLSITAPTGPTTNVDMPTTGVGAGTYGDSTHVAEVTVDAEGRITAASSVAISGSGGAGGLITLYDSGYLGSDAASIDTGAGGIASGHGNLYVWLYLRTADAVTGQNITGRINNDSGTNYNEQRTRASTAGLVITTATAQTSALLGIAPGANATANTFGPMTIEIPAYDQTTNKKAFNASSSIIDGVAADMIQDLLAVQWTGTAAISRFSVFSQGGGNLKAGSRMMVLGTQ